MRGKDVSFVFVSGEIVPFWKVTSNQRNFVSDVIFYVPSSKTDKGREGFKFVYSKGSAGQIDVCDVALRWALSANIQSEDPFFRLVTLLYYSYLAQR